LPVLSGSQVNEISTQVAGTLNVTNNYPKNETFFKHLTLIWIGGSCEVVTTYGRNHEFINF